MYNSLLTRIQIPLIGRLENFLAEFQILRQCLHFLTRSLNIGQQMDRTHKQKVCGSEGQKPPSDKRKVKTKETFGCHPREGCMSLCVSKKAPASLPPAHRGLYTPDLNTRELLIF